MAETTQDREALDLGAIRADLDRRVPARDVTDRGHCRVLLAEVERLRAEVERLRREVYEAEEDWAARCHATEAERDAALARAGAAEVEVERLRLAEHGYHWQVQETEKVAEALDEARQQVADLRAVLDDERAARRIAGEAADRFRDVLADCLGHDDENPGDDVLVAEVRTHFGRTGPEPTRWRDFLTGARARLDQIEAMPDPLRALLAETGQSDNSKSAPSSAKTWRSPAPVVPDSLRERMHENWRVFKKHVPAGAYLPVGQVDGDCRECGGSWPCDAVLAVVGQGVSADRRLSPVHPLGNYWKPGERVEYVWRNGNYAPEETRPGTVVRIDREYGYREHLVVKFDDGEERAINPDVMRHVRPTTQEPTTTEGA